VPVNRFNAYKQFLRNFFRGVLLAGKLQYFLFARRDVHQKPFWLYLSRHVVLYGLQRAGVNIGAFGMDGYDAGASFSGTVNLNGVTTPINTVTQTVTIPKGSYSLLLLGINWGGGQEYKININGDDYGIYPYEATGTDGLAYHSQPIAITI